MKIILIRHGATLGNLSKRYIGTTDEPLLKESEQELKQKKYPKIDFLYVSPMQRCIQTALIIYPNHDYVICDDLRECDFGEFENKNYIELNGNCKYQAWIDSCGTLPFPNGESNTEFRQRCYNAFEKIVKTHSDNDTIAFIIHGGTIMSILEHFYIPKSEFYDWQVENGGGYILNGTIEASNKEKNDDFTLRNVDRIFN